MRAGILIIGTLSIIAYGCVVPDRPESDFSIAEVELERTRIKTQPLSSPSPSPTVHPLDPCSDTLGKDLNEMTLAYVLGWESDAEIFTVQADGARLKQLTDNQVPDFTPKWSPDGKFIAYITTRSEDDERVRIQLISDDGVIQKFHTGDLEAYSDFSWSPNGLSISFREDAGTEIDIFLMNIETNDIKNLTQGHAYRTLSPIWSSDGLNLAFISVSTDMEELTYEIYTIRLSSDSLEIRNVPLDLQGDILQLKWHPNQDLLMVAMSDFGIWGEIYQIDPETKEVVQVTEDGSSKFNPQWSPDGSMISYLALLPDEDPSDGFDPNQLWVMNADGAEGMASFDIPGSITEIYDYEWAPDSRHIAFNATAVEGSNRSTNIYILNVCSGELNILVEDAPLASYSWKPLIEE